MLLNQLLRSIVCGELSQLKKIEVMMKLSSVDPELLSLALVRLEGCVLWGFDQPATLQLNAILSRIIETEDSLLSSLYISGLSWSAVSADLVARAEIRLERLRQRLSEQTSAVFMALSVFEAI